MNIKFKSNLASGIFSIIFSLVLWFLIPSQVALNRNEGTFLNAQFMPKMVAIIIFIGGILLVLQSRLKEDKTIEISLGNELKSLLYIIVLIIYGVLLSNIGFLFSSIFLGVMTLVLLKNKNWKYYAIIISLVVILKVVFNYLLGVQLP